jgi:2-hydroxymuconate-semialdehyde hydrolase
MLEGIAVSERRIAVAGVTTAVLEGGRGPSLVLLHGGIPCGGVYWAPVLTSLLDRHHVVVPDLPGLGESEPFDRLDTGSFADWLSALVLLTCEDKPALIAHSLLGGLAVSCGGRLRDHVRRLVLYGAPGIGPYRMPLGLRATAIRFDLRPTPPNLERFERWAFHDLEGARRRDAAWLAAFESYLLNRGAVQHVKRTMRRLVRVGSRRIPDSALRQIGVPTALLWGEGDRMVPRTLAEQASRRFGWPLHLIEDSGHVPHIERPELFQCALESALERSIVTTTSPLGMREPQP